MWQKRRTNREKNVKHKREKKKKHRKRKTTTNKKENEKKNEKIPDGIFSLFSYYNFSIETVNYYFSSYFTSNYIQILFYFWRFKKL